MLVPLRVHALQIGLTCSCARRGPSGRAQAEVLAVSARQAQCLGCSHSAPWAMRNWPHWRRAGGHRVASWRTKHEGKMWLLAFSRS